jgi:hypothetical protein
LDGYRDRMFLLSVWAGTTVAQPPNEQGFGVETVRQRNPDLVVLEFLDQIIGFTCNLNVMSR